LDQSAHPQRPHEKRWWYWERGATANSIRGEPPGLIRRFSVRSEAVEIGMLVQVNKGFMKPHLQGLIGSVKQRYGDVSYAAFEVYFRDVSSELFWHHELAAVPESAA